MLNSTHLPNNAQALSAWSLSEKEKTDGCGVFSIHVNPDAALARQSKLSMSDMQLNIYAEHGILEEV